jgi:hypothetical protein
MGMFEQEEVKGDSPYTDLAMGDADNGTEWFFYFDNRKTANSQEYGEFAIWQGVAFNGAAKNKDELVKSFQLASLIPNTLLQNKAANGAFSMGEAYRLKKEWSKGDKFEGGKKAKGHGYKVFRLKASTDVLDAMKAFHDEALGGAGLGSDDSSAQSSGPVPEV